MAKKSTARYKSYFWLLVTAVTWGAALIVVKPAFEVTTPFRFLFYRYLVAVALSLPWLIYYWQKQGSHLWAKIKVIVPLELLGTTLALTLLYFGLDRTSAVEASLLATTAPIFVTVAGILVLKEKQERHESLGLALAFIGTVLLTVVPIVTNGGFQGLSLMGNLLIIAYNVTAALFFVLAKKYYHHFSKLFACTISFYVGLISFFLLSWLESATSLTGFWQIILSDWTHSSVWFASLYMAFFGSIIGLTAYIKGQDGIEASEASLFIYLEPLVYVPLAYVLLGEAITMVQILLLLLVLIGVFISEKRFGRRR